MSKVVQHAGYRVRTPKGSTSLTENAKQKISRLASDLASKGKRLSTSNGCTIVFLGSKAIQRCEGRSLSSQAKARWARVRGKKVCRARGGANQGKFKRCR